MAIYNGHIPKQENRREALLRLFFGKPGGVEKRLHRFLTVTLTPAYQFERRVTMDEQTYIITFDDVSAADANRYAEELRQALLDASPDVEVHRRRDDPRTQDFGATLVLLLGTPAAVTVARAIGNWLALRRGTISIEAENGEITKITGTNLSNEAQLKVLEIMKKK